MAAGPWPGMNIVSDCASERTRCDAAIIPSIDPLREPVELVEVVLLEMRVPQAEVMGRVDGSPAVSDKMFFGVEHPAEHCREQRAALAGGQGTEPRFRCRAGRAGRVDREIRGGRHARGYETAAGNANAQAVRSR